MRFVDKRSSAKNELYLLSPTFRKSDLKYRSWLLKLVTVSEINVFIEKNTFIFSPLSRGKRKQYVEAVAEHLLITDNDKQLLLYICDSSVSTLDNKPT